MELADDVEAMVDMLAAATDPDGVLAIGNELRAVLLAPPVEDSPPDETAPDLSDRDGPNDGDAVLVVERLFLLQRDEVGRGEDGPNLYHGRD